MWNFIKNDKQYPVLFGVAAGLYPFLFYYSNNYTLINSLSHLGYFISIFLLLPIVGFYLAHRFSKFQIFEKIRPYILPFLSVFTFLFLLKVAIHASIHVLWTLVVLVIAVLFTFFLRKYLKKVVVLQFVLAITVLFTLIPTLVKQYNYSKAWREQPDAIAQAIFKTKPNVYFIQPDGYVNFSELKKGYYKIDNTAFESFLEAEGFKHYPDFRSNYASTLTSNSSVFMMKHHYYNKGLNFTETLHARDIIISENTVLDIFKSNGYKTHFLAERPYLLVSKPKIGYDFANYDYNDINYINTGMVERQDVVVGMHDLLSENFTSPSFFFVEIFSPGHVSVRKTKSLGVDKERLAWKDSLMQTNIKLKKIVRLIKEKDPNGLIVILADHGGFVGMDFMHRAYEKTTDRDLIHSIFSSNLAILWPDNEKPKLDESLKTSVNLFRVLVAYLSEESSYLSHLQDDGSYIPIREGAPKGVYQYISPKGKVTFKKVDGSE